MEPREDMITLSLRNQMKSDRHNSSRQKTIIRAYFKKKKILTGSMQHVAELLGNIII